MRRFKNAPCRVAIAVTSLSAALAAPALADQFPFGLHLYSSPAGMTQDLSVGVPLAKDGSAVGATFYATSGPSTRYGARITPLGIVNFSDPSKAFDISDGGAYTVDLRTRRSASGAIDQVLPANTQYLSQSRTPSISGGGSVVVGCTEVVSSGTVVGSNAYRWTEQSGLQALPGYRADAIFTTPQDLSQDGSTMVGHGRTQFFANDNPWKWTQASGFTELPRLPGAQSTYSTARGVNSDGSIIVGDGGAPIANRFWGMVWRGDQVTGLPPLPAYRSATAYDLSNNGSVITGVNDSPVDSSTGVLLSISTIWTESTGWVPALDYFRAQGVEIPSYLVTSSVINVSADGKTFSTTLFDTRTSQGIMAVIAIPTPSIAPALGVIVALSRRTRRLSPSL